MTNELLRTVGEDLMNRQAALVSLVLTAAFLLVRELAEKTLGMSRFCLFHRWFKAAWRQAQARHQTTGNMCVEAAFL